MKLQYMIIIFAIIIIPITLLLSLYIQSQTDSIALGTKYDTMLLDATYDAIIAFQSNTLNNENSSNKDTLRESISASINVFSNSLSNNMGVGGYSKEYLMPYVPALAYTMYDGFYIYSPINNLQVEKETVESVDEFGNPIIIDNIKNVNLNYEHVLKPYIYYSEVLENGYIINYSLDNYITIYGDFNNNGARSGYLINSDDVIIDGNEVIYKNEEIEDEVLSENVSIMDDETKTTNIKEYPFVYSTDHEKIYKDSNNNLFRVVDYKIQYIISGVSQYKVIDGQIKSEQINPNDFLDQSARVYYVEAKDFTDWVNLNIGRDIEYLRISEDNGNNPENESSKFVQHKREVIKDCIENNLNNAINSYNSQSGKEYNFKMPKIKEEDWEQIYRNVSFISFLQGIPSGLKIYNNYSVVTSTGNKEYIDPNDIYYIGNDGSYHNINCSHLESIKTGYKKSDFDDYRKYYNSSEHYYRHSTKNDGKTEEESYIPACYYCIIDATQTELATSDVINSRQRYKYTALARERYNLIKTTQNLK